MESADDAYIRHRELVFRGPQKEQDQLEAAWLMLRDEVPAIREVHRDGDRKLQVTYDIREITYAELEQALTEVGFHMDNSLLSKLRRALYNYGEDTVRDNLGLVKDESISGVAQRVFVNQYRQQAHGCRDQRPRHWREYL
ncbi:hypothetical protein M911_03390 [Ectothiorhodospira haloalkaliphila]|uniref:Uncharacterized protein n=1 Tax=Ectothiorhodospira haloalkaliphila TaxID=421628 RepID=W8KF21_9GAMM|nr:MULTISPECIES: hypothetical protein [Ectothiorhodospira]AHK78379.1 hypothetical protein M911_03390 [Ectothiorhodospira haloalkaliphila]MCG5495654.1 hypothetical protein [Ectothiorhodospira variabilis]MCG5498849.1 hypothetical protein [Ectothiorhodospira variabilis]MCG5504715.1 hypothetical protein [Ectothiorhodospira variabilis]MCG5507872.1 hypothetical protein [Ectothiorhodospira variabilis]